MILQPSLRICHTGSLDVAGIGTVEEVAGDEEQVGALLAGELRGLLKCLAQSLPALAQGRGRHLGVMVSQVIVVYRLWSIVITYRRVSAITNILAHDANLAEQS
jgi:hypothetical protein